MTSLRTLTFIVTASILFACGGKGQTEKSEKEKQTSIRLDTLPELKKIVEGLEQGYAVESSHIGEGGSPSDQWDKYEQLKKVATNDQLVQLTDHKSPVVRCYAFQALASKRSDQVFKVLLNHLHDTAMVFTRSGCIGMDEHTGDYFIDVVTPRRVELDIYKLNSTERKILDSILFNDESILLWEKSTVLETIAITAGNYPRLRQLVKKERELSALRTLAKYQKQTDRELIASFFKDEDTQSSALRAVKEFPDEYFYPFVTKVFEQEWKKELYDYPKWRICYQVLARYPRPHTIELFDRTTQAKDAFRYETLCKSLLVAITKYPDKTYEPIKLKINLNSYVMEEVKDELANDY